MPSSLSTPKHEIKHLSGQTNTAEWLCVTDPRKRVLGKIDKVVKFLLPDPPKPERKASLAPGKAVLGFNFPIKQRMNWGLRNVLSLDF